jgi:hypothetical protein
MSHVKANIGAEGVAHLLLSKAFDIDAEYVDIARGFRAAADYVECCRAGFDSSMLPSVGAQPLPYLWCIMSICDIDPRGPDCAIQDYLVTEPGDIDRPIAVIDVRGDSSDPRLRASAAALATTIVRGTAVRGDHALAWTDLRPFGRPDSTEPVPAWVYALECMPASETGLPIVGPLRTPFPVCPIRLGRAMASSRATVESALKRAALHGFIAKIFGPSEAKSGARRTHAPTPGSNGAKGRKAAA